MDLEYCLWPRHLECSASGSYWVRNPLQERAIAKTGVRRTRRSRYPFALWPFLLLLSTSFPCPNVRPSVWSLAHNAMKFYHHVAAGVQSD